MLSPASSDGANKIISRTQTAAVFVNPQAERGRSRRALPKIEAAFQRHGFHATIQETNSVEELEQRVEEALRDGVRHLFAFGGDGTLQGLVNAAYGRDVLFGVIPAGGGNDFARALNLPLDPLGAISAALSGTPRSVDLVRVSTADGATRFYLGGGGVGLDSESAKLANSRYKNRNGRLRYVSAALHAYCNYKPQRVRVTFDDFCSEARWQNFVLSSSLNTPTFGAGIRLSPSARIDDGLLDYAFLPDLSLGLLLQALPQLLFSGLLNLPNLQRKQARKIRIETEKPVHFQGDGELIGLTPVEIEIVPGAARFLAPKVSGS
jgi:diacylglycerol kinase (ATP)